jgi:hypothetical protein
MYELDLIEDTNRLKTAHNNNNINYDQIKCLITT